MCGIAGFFERAPSAAAGASSHDDPAALRRLDAMGETIRHRGPDAHGSTFHDGVGLHSRRLAILDLSPDGNQPMFSSDGQVAVVFNGEIFNFQELRRELEAAGCRFRSRSDTEVLVHGYAKWGFERLLPKLNGFFGFALHDRRARRLWIARDRLGVKPMHYALTPRGLFFGSELKALLEESGLARELDPTALLDFLCLRYVPAPKTIWRDARKLPAGHWLRVERDARGELALTVQRWWDLPPFGTRRERPERLAEELWELLVDSVRLRLLSDVPLGAFLSGGLDSSAVVAAMAQLAGPKAGDVHAVTIGFQGWDRSEVEHARVVARALGVRHTVDELAPAAIEHVDALADYFDEPFADPSAVPTWLLARRARRDVTVALSGDGGDECFAGYRRYRFDLAEHRVRSLLPGPMFRGLFRAAGALFPKGDWLPRPLRAKTTLENLGRSPLHAYFRSLCALPVGEARTLLCAELRDAVAGYDPVESLRPWYEAAPATDPLSRAQYADFHTWLPEYVLAKSDRATMAASLEAREPLLDWRIVELAAAMPPDVKVRAGVGKWILRRAVEPHLPKHTIERGKQGFAPPLKDWVKLELARPTTRLEAPSSIDPAALDAAIRRHRAGLRDLSEPLYAVLVLRAFERRWLARPAPAPALAGA
jgi:asparagine synthase (glutamine-hydrolysing)